MKNAALLHCKCRANAKMSLGIWLFRLERRLICCFLVLVAPTAYVACSLLHCNLNHILPAAAEHVIFGRTSCLVVLGWRRGQEAGCAGYISMYLHATCTLLLSWHFTCPAVEPRPFIPPGVIPWPFLIAWNKVARGSFPFLPLLPLLTLPMTTFYCMTIYWVPLVLSFVFWRFSLPVFGLVTAYFACFGWLYIFIVPLVFQPDTILFAKRSGFFGCLVTRDPSRVSATKYATKCS